MPLPCHCLSVPKTVPRSQQGLRRRRRWKSRRCSAGAPTPRRRRKHRPSMLLVPAGRAAALSWVLVPVDSCKDGSTGAIVGLHLCRQRGGGDGSSAGMGGPAAQGLPPPCARKMDAASRSKWVKQLRFISKVKACISLAFRCLLWPFPLPFPPPFTAFPRPFTAFSTACRCRRSSSTSTWTATACSTWYAPTPVVLWHCLFIDQHYSLPASMPFNGHSIPVSTPFQHLSGRVQPDGHRDRRRVRGACQQATAPALPQSLLSSEAQPRRQ